MVGKIAIWGQSDALGRSSLVAEHCCIVALLEELGLEVVVAEPEFRVVAVGLEKGPHSPEVSKS